MTELGVCPAAIDSTSDGTNEGKNGGRICWALTGTLCGGQVQGTFAQKRLACTVCEFFEKVKEEQAAGFLLLRGAQRVEDVLRESEERYRAMFDGVPVGLYRTTAAGRFLDANPAMVDVLGYPDKEALLATNAGELYVNLDDRSRWQALMEREGAVRGFDVEMCRRDGTLIWARNSARAVRDEQGQVLYYEGVIEDITERKRAEGALRQARDDLERRIEDRTAELGRANATLQAEVAERRRIDGVLRESEERFRRLAEEAQDIVYRYELRPTRGYTYVSPAVTRTIGYTPEEHYADPDLPLKLAHPDDAPALQALIEGRDVPEQFTARVRHKDGRTVWLERRIVPVFDEAGNLVAFEGIARDATDRKLAEAEQARLLGQALAAEAKLSALLESVPDAILIVNRLGRIVLVNRQAEETFGYRREELLRLPVEALIPERFRVEHAEHRAAYPAASWTMVSGREVVARRSDGSEFPADVGLNAVQADGEILVTAIVRDIAERKRAEAERAELIRVQAARVAAEASQRRATLLAEASRAFAEASLELQPVLDAVARRVAAAIGDACLIRLLSADGKWLDPVALYHPDAEALAVMQGILAGTRHRVDEGLHADMMRTGRPLLIPVISPEQLRASTKPENWPHLERYGARSMLIAPLRVRGRVIGTLGISRDRQGQPYTLADQELLQDLADRAALAIENARLYREVKERIVQVQQAQQQLIQQERLHALGQMASGIAHDFNNALVPVLGFSELLLLRPEYLSDKDRAHEYLSFIQTAARDAANVVSRLREFYRARDVDEMTELVGLHQLVGQAISLTQPRWKDQAQAQGIDIGIQAELQPVPPIAGNEADLREALTNLIFNAVDAMPQGGTIAVRVHPEGDGAVLEVRDTGIGMTDEVRRRCLEPFFTTKGERGTGLGLAMVYGIVRRHDGKITIESAEGHGTTVSIYLPYRLKQDGTSGPEESVAPLRPLRVLLVDDEPMVRSVLEAYLATDGHAVVSAVDGIDGLAQFQTDRFDVVVTDRALPGMSGERLAAAVKQIAPATPVILLTGFGDLMEAAGGRPAGVDLVVGKPITLGGLRQAMAAVMSSEERLTIP